MESRIDESKLKIFKPRLGKSMLGIGSKFYSSSSANVRIAGMARLPDICRLRNWAYDIVIHLRMHPHSTTCDRITLKWAVIFEYQIHIKPAEYREVSSHSGFLFT